MILEREPVSMVQVTEIVKQFPENEKKEQIDAFLKKYSKTKQKQAEKITRELTALDLLKLKKEHIVKIIDMLPQDATDAQKIFFDVSLTEDEIHKILDIVKNSG
jgi:DNA-directed RNA polymerase subunit F